MRTSTFTTRFRTSPSLPEKRDRLATVPLVDEAVTAARAFLNSDAFAAWSTSSATKAIRTAARKGNLKPFTVYQIRHSFATWLRHAGADLADIQDLYGHTDPTTTRIYPAPMLAKQRNAVRRLRVVAEGARRAPLAFAPVGGNGVQWGNGGDEDQNTVTCAPAASAPAVPAAAVRLAASTGWQYFATSS